MIKNIDITGIRFDLNPKVEAYVKSKIGRLDRYMPRHARASARAEVKLIASPSNKKNKYTCEVVLHLPNGFLTAKESTLNILAAVDIAEAKLKNQLKKYKEKHTQHKNRRRSLLKVLRDLADRG